jgi:hypothetical protein
MGGAGTSGIHVESERGDDKTSHVILYTRRDVAIQDKKRIACEIWGKVDMIRGGKG